MRYLTTLAFLLSFSFGQAQVDLTFYYGKQFPLKTEIKAPGELTGHTFGEWHFSHDQMVHYLTYLANTSDRIKMVEYGRTHENRPLYNLIISSPENIANIDDIQKKHIDWIYSRNNQTSSNDIPLIVWLGYNVHGNESSAGNGALLTSYYLAASMEETLKNTLANTVIIIDPCLNPDGFNRAASWVNMHQSKNWIDDQSSIQFSEYWPGGRTNHYWFDLNRDWLLLQHPESQSRVAAFQQWKPAVLTDHHETGTNGTFFFQPGVPSRINPLTPDDNYTLTYKIGTYHSKALDNIGSLYFSEESFDDFYFGKGSSYPDINGAIGILFEQSRVNGQIVNNIHGTTTFAQAIRNQFTVSLSTIKAASENKIEFQEYQKRFYSSALQKAKNDPIKGYAFGCKEDPVRMNYFMKVLRSHQIDIYKNAGIININNSTFHPNEAYVVPVNQHQYRLIKSIFDKVTTFKDSVFYDISTWTMPLTFDIDYKTINSTSKILGEKVENFDLPKGKLVGTTSHIGYLFNWSNYNAPKALQDLFELGIKAKVATKPLQVKVNNQVVDFTYGSIFIPATKQIFSSADLHSSVQEIAIKNGVEIYSLENGFRHSGIHFGSSSFIPLQSPKILMLVGNGTSSRQAGEIWHLFDHRLDIPITRIDVDRFYRIDLFKYNTLILPGGNITFNKSDSEKIQVWLKNGGNIIALGSSANELKKHKWIDLKIRKNEHNDSLVRYDYASRRNRSRGNSVDGIILDAQIDHTHPIGYGFMDRAVPVFKNNSFILEKNKDPYSCPVYIGKNSLLSGHLNPKSKKHIENSAYVLNYNVGRGHVVVFADNPNFRGIWYGTNKLFVNAVFFGGVIRGY